LNENTSYASRGKWTCAELHYLDIEFQRAHCIGKKKTGETRPVIVRFLRFPEREMVFKRAREMQEETNVKVYADYPKENKRKKETTMA